MRRHNTARPAIVAANISRRPPRVRSISGPKTGATSANGARVSTKYRITFGRAWLVVALKNNVSASETVTNTSPATPIAYASASRANGGNVVDSSLGRAFVITTYPSRRRFMRPRPAFSGTHLCGIPFGDAPGRRQSRGRLAPLPRPRAVVARVQRPGAGAR